MPNRSWNWSFRKTGYSERQKQIDVWVKQYVIDRLIDLVVRYELYLSHKNKIQQHSCKFSGLKRYKILSLIGDGTYGLVYLATNIETRERVAIKAMKRKYHSWDEVGSATERPSRECFQILLEGRVLMTHWSFLERKRTRPIPRSVVCRVIKLLWRKSSRFPQN